jgi:hypothetical protein
MKKVLIALWDDGQIEALNAAIKDRIENLQSNIDCVDHDDPNETENIEAFVSERDALEAVLEGMGEAVEGEALVIVKGGLVRDIYATVDLDVTVWDMDVEDDDRNHDEADIEPYTTQHNMVGVY